MALLPPGDEISREQHHARLPEVLNTLEMRVFMLIILV